MKRYRPILAVGLAVLVLALCLTPRPAKAFSLGTILEAGGIAFLVSEYGDRINSFINSALGEREAQAAGATKVVPILSIGQGAYLGASQVVGAPDRVRTVKAVIQGELAVGSLQATAYFPVTTTGGIRNPSRVTGTGISAVVQFQLR